MQAGARVLPLFRFPFLRGSMSISRSFAASSGGTAGTSPTNIVLPPNRMEKAFVDLDTEKLAKYACINYFKDGKDPELKGDSEYPDWIWRVRTEPFPPLEEMTEEEYGWDYWRVFMKKHRKQELLKKKLSFKYSAVQRNVKIL